MGKTKLDEALDLMGFIQKNADLLNVNAELTTKLVKNMEHLCRVMVDLKERVERLEEIRGLGYPLPRDLN